MKINFYTISTNSFHTYTTMMLNSFVKNNSCQDNRFYVLTLDNIIEPVKHNNIIYYNCSEIITKYLNTIDIHSMINRICWWMKSRCVEFPEILNTDYLVHVDGDILFFKDISLYIESLMQNNDDSYFYAANDGHRILSNKLINSGFYFANIHKYPFVELMNDWGSRMLELIPNIYSYRKTNKLLFKYLDQTTLKEFLHTERFNKYEVLDPHFIGYRRHNSNLVLAHYIKKHKWKMFRDYEAIIDPPQNPHLL